MNWGYTRTMKVKFLVLGVLVGSTTFAAVPAKPPIFKLHLGTLERCPASVSAGFETLELKMFFHSARALFRGPAQIKPIPLARPLESKICPIPLAK